MEFNFILPKNFKAQSVKHLLEETWMVPRKQRYFLHQKKHFWVNDELVSEEKIVVSADKIKIIFDIEDFKSLEVAYGQSSFAEILFEDEHFVIANKPEGMKTHPNIPGELALQNHVAAAVNQPVYVVHRLDELTSGAVLFAKNQFVLPILGKMFEDNLIHREYVALVHGHFNDKTFTIHEPIGKDRHDKRKQVVSKSGKDAITHVSVLSDFKRKSLIKVTLDTGRTHQIRVHLSSLIHPIVGDHLYGSDKNESRLMLHARQLTFLNPFTAEEISVSATSQTFDTRCQQEK